ncbi:MAG: ABC transporter permease [Nanoarchaeota archaeon]|nr:ABC transporter permease [Nanoarchaeota archaeon]
MIDEYLRMAIRTIKKRRARSILTIVGIFIAILTIFVLISLSLGLNDVIKEQFEILGGDKFFVQPKGTLMPGSDTTVSLTLKDVETLEKINEVKSVTYFAASSVKIEFNDEVRYYLVAGVPLEEDEDLDWMFETMNIGAEEGRLLKRGDSGKVLIGYNYRFKNLFEKPVEVGDKIKLNGEEFEVVGIVEEIGNPGDDAQIYLGWEKDYKNLLNSGDNLDYIMVQIKDGEDMELVSKKAERKLMRARDLTEDTLDFSILTPTEILETFNTILLILTFFLVGIGGISLVVGGIGIANTMYTSVLERKKEIGTMKAIGATNPDILYIFIIESGILGLLGGILGLLGGIAIAKIVEAVVAASLGSGILRASLHPALLIGCISFAFLIGIFSGFLPSKQASALRPVDALRYE